MEEEYALNLVDAKDFSDLTGGRNGTASTLIGLVKEANEGLPASDAQKELIRNLAEKTGIAMRDVLALAELAEESDISKSDASTIINKLKSIRKKGGKKKGD